MSCESKYKTANYYARAIVMGLLLWFLLLFTIGYYWVRLASDFGGIGQVFSIVLLLVLCLVIGYLANRLTWKYLIINKL
jgi:membrane protein DedA with SNARE-associated domain